MELRFIQHLCVAGEVSETDARAQALRLLYLTGALLLLRAVMSALLPLSFDEAYYWRWSQHLAAGYWDHPPLIAFVIRFGTMLFGDSEFGVRFGTLLLSLATSWAVWRAGTILLRNEYYGALSALFYNVTLMAGVEALVATPDAPSMTAAAFFLFALAKVQETGRGAWWIAAGIAGGFALLAKYTGFFLGAGAILWLLLVPTQRHWFRSFWPYLGAAIALILFAPVVAWNAAHDWISFERQFGRAGGTHFTLRFLGEFLAGQIAFATPFFFVLGVAGLGGILFSRKLRTDRLMLLAALMLPALLYFFWHSLHDRVQGNWPSFLYPTFALCAVATLGWALSGWGGRALRFSQRAALPVALGLSVITYTHALRPILPIEGTRDPIARLLAVGYAPLSEEFDVFRIVMDANAILTTSYAQTGWLSFYLPSDAPVVQINERARWLNEPQPDEALFEGPLLYITEERRDLSSLLAGRFEIVERIGSLMRQRDGVLIENYNFYRVENPTGPVLDPP